MPFQLKVASNRDRGHKVVWTIRRSRRRAGAGFVALQWIVLQLVLTATFLQPPLLLGQGPNIQNELQAAAAAEQTGQYEEAATLYQRFLSGRDSSKADSSVLIHVRTRLATAYFLLHRYRESLDAVLPLTSKDSGYVGVPAQAWLVDGLDQLELGQLPGAVVSLRRTLALNPDSGTARLALGDAFERSSRLEEAAREYEEQTRRTPAVPDAWYKLGLAYARLSTQILRDFSQKFPASIVGQQLTAEDLLAKGDSLGAAGPLLRLVRRAPSQPSIHADLGAALLDQGFPKSAEDQFRQELSQDPDCPLARLGLAQITALRGDWEQATTDLERLARLQPRELAQLLEVPPSNLLHQAWEEGKIQLPERFVGLPGGILWRAWLTGSDSQPMPAGTSLSCSNPLARAISTPGLWLSEACYRQLNDRLKAKKTLTVEERIKLAEAEFRLGDNQAARREAQRVLASDPRSEWGLYWLGLSNSGLGEECFSKVSSMNPESARVHQMLGEYYASRHYFPHAKTEYLAAIQLAPNLPDLHMALAEVHWVTGEWPEAEKEFLRTLELAPGSTFAQYELGDTYAQQRRWEPAIDHLRRALAEPSLAVKVRLDLAQAEDEMGQTQQAVKELLPVLKEDRDGQIHYRLAKLYRKIGDKTRERVALATFKQLHADSVRTDRSELEVLETQRETVEHANTPKPPQ